VSTRSAKKCVNALIGIAIWCCAYSAPLFAVEFDDRLYLPVKVAQGLDTLDGVDADRLLTSSAVRTSPFARDYAKSKLLVTKTKQYRGDFKFEAISTLEELTERSSFAVRASARNPMFSVALSTNRDRDLAISEQSLRLYAFTRYEVESKVFEYRDLPAQAFTADVQALQRRLEDALTRKDLAAASKVREEFRAVYGTGFIKQVSRGGMFYLQKTQTFSSRAERDRAKLSFEGSGYGVDANVNSDQEQRKKYERAFTGISGEFAGGSYVVTDPTWDNFVNKAN